MNLLNSVWLQQKRVNLPMAVLYRSAEIADTPTKMVNVSLIIKNAITAANWNTLASAVENGKYLLLVAEIQEKERQVLYWQTLTLH